MFPAQVVLDTGDCVDAAQVAAWRQNESELRGHKMFHNARGGDDGRRNHLMGCQSELAVCRFLGVAWTRSVNTFTHEPDAVYKGIPLEIRSVPMWVHEPTLKIKKNDNPFQVAVLVLANAPFFTIEGWIRISDARVMDQYFITRKRKDGKDSSQWEIPAGVLEKGEIR